MDPNSLSSGAYTSQIFLQRRYHTVLMKSLVNFFYRQTNGTDESVAVEATTKPEQVLIFLMLLHLMTVFFRYTQFTKYFLQLASSLFEFYHLSPNNPTKGNELTFGIVISGNIPSRCFSLFVAAM